MDPRVLNSVDFVAQSGGDSSRLNPMAVVPPGVEPFPLGKVSLLATIPTLTNGIASYFLVPLSIGVGRRPVLLFAAACAWAGGLGAGFSQSFEMHLAARAVQGLGVGAVEALIPLIVQDIVFIHQRNKAMSLVVSTQVSNPWVFQHPLWRLSVWISLLTISQHYRESSSSLSA